METDWVIVAWWFITVVTGVVGYVIGYLVCGAKAKEKIEEIKELQGLGTMAIYRGSEQN